MEYKLISANMMATLGDLVTEAMQEGWHPHGSLVNTQSHYIQPMTRVDAYTLFMEEDRRVEKELMG